jgi:ribosome-associated protein
MTGFTETLIICSGGNSKQIQAIADEIEDQMKAAGDPPLHVEGYTTADWILLDFGDYVINVFSEKARGFYDLERLWRDARVIEYTPAEASV